MALKPNRRSRVSITDLNCLNARTKKSAYNKPHSPIFSLKNWELSKLTLESKEELAGETEKLRTLKQNESLKQFKSGIRDIIKQFKTKRLGQTGHGTRPTSILAHKQKAYISSYSEYLSSFGKARSYNEAIFSQICPETKSMNLQAKKTQKPSKATWTDIKPLTSDSSIRGFHTTFSRAVAQRYMLRNTDVASNSLNKTNHTQQRESIDFCARRNSDLLEGWTVPLPEQEVNSHVFHSKKKSKPKRFQKNRL